MHSTANRTGRLVGMDGVRGLAAVSVLLYHCWLYGDASGSSGDTASAVLRHLAAGVLVFFSLSGLLLYRPYAAAILGTSRQPALRSYVWNRAVRIVPAYWVVLGLVAVVAGAALRPDEPGVGRLIDEPDVLAADLALVHSFLPAWLFTGIGPAWTLSVEIVFYVALPVIAVLVLRLASGQADRRRVLLAFVPPVAMLGIGLAGKVAAAAVLDGRSGWHRSWSSVLARSFLANADLFAFGMAVAVVSVLVAEGRLGLPRWWRTATFAVAIVFGLAALSIRDGVLSEPRYDILVAIAASLVLATLVVGDGQSSRTVRLLADRRLIGIGLASYSLYLWHEPVVHWLVDHGVLRGTGMPRVAMAIALVGTIAGVLSALTYRFVEAPALRRKRPHEAVGVRDMYR